MNKKIDDWEYSEDFYKNETKKELKLEDFMDESMDLPHTISANNHRLERLNKASELVTKIRKESEAGASIEAIAASTGQSQQAVTAVLMALTWSSEDSDDQSVAGLILDDLEV